MRFNQRKIIKFNHLLANMLIFHTMVYQIKTINQEKDTAEIEYDLVM